MARSTEPCAAEMGPARSRANAPGMTTVNPLESAMPRMFVTGWLMRRKNVLPCGTEVAPKDVVGGAGVGVGADGSAERLAEGAVVSAGR